MEKKHGKNIFVNLFFKGEGDSAQVTGQTTSKVKANYITSQHTKNLEVIDKVTEEGLNAYVAKNAEGEIVTHTAIEKKKLQSYFTPGFFNSQE